MFGCSKKTGRWRLFFIATLIIGSALLNASSTSFTQKSDFASLYADRYESKDGVTYAYGHIVLTYDHSMIIGKRARYDHKKSIVYVEGGVEVFGANGSKVYADSIVFDVGKNRINFKDFFHNDTNDIWVLANNAISQDNNYTLNNSMLSSCSTNCPDWSLKFKRADYNATSKKMVLRDARFYAKKIPLLYIPYLSFSLDRQRSTGFLMPHFGYNGDDGFIYEQPFFWAISPGMDLELEPQIRTLRGAGLYGTFRFADSANSIGEIKAGYFKDKSSYQNEHNLKNSEHYGVEFLYKSSDFLKGFRPYGYTDGLYLSINLFNDIDYINLQQDQLFHYQETSRYKESRFNYFLYNDNQYFGIGARYYIDTEKIDNEDTIQEIPRLQYHKFSSEIINRHLTYSIDAQFHNYYKESGDGAYRTDITLPVSLQFSLADGYINILAEEEFKVSDTLFSRDFETYKTNRYSHFIANHKLQLSTDLIKEYTSGIHTMMLTATYTKSTLMAEGSLKYDDLNSNIINDYNIMQLEESRVSFAMHHFWNSNSGDFSADYQAIADIYPQNSSDWNYFRQELTLRYKKWYFNSRLDYSMRDRELSEFSNMISYKNDNYAISFDYIWKKDEFSYTVNQRELEVKGHYRYSENLTVYGGITYDFYNDYSKDWEAGFLYDKKCWNLQLTFRQETTPVLRNSGAGSIHNNTIMFKFNLIPFGGTGIDKKYL